MDMKSAIIPAIIAFVAQILLCPVCIPLLHRLKFGQYIRAEGPKEHQKKAGTPTMGGIMILVSLTLGVVLFFHFNSQIIAALLVTWGFGLIGFLDDYIKVVKKNNEGLKPLQKWVLQCLVACLFVLYLGMTGVGTAVSIPFTKIELDLGVFYYPFAFILMMAFVNGVNFTDGLDGLASGVTVIVTAFFAVVCWGQDSDLMPVASAVAGSLLGFLLFNVNPAKVFMGDTGSLALGGFVSALALMLNIPLLLVIVGFIYVAEVLSVVLQVTYFKATHGKRLFRMAPIHHHFELGGWKETKVVSVFVIITAILCLIGLLAL